MDKKLLEILVCPACKGPLVYDKSKAELVCRADKLAYPIRDDIPVMLEDEARRVPDDELPKVAPAMHVIIPARYASTRLPGKALADVGGKTLIERVYERARESGADQIIIATDDERIRRVAESFGANVRMTSAHHATGTDRIGEVVSQLGLNADEIVVSLQGDEPMMPASLIREVGAVLAKRRDANVATACHPITDRESFLNPNIVKVVLDENGYASYFSRAPIPWPRDLMRAGTPAAIQALRHIGLYAYRAGFIARYCAWPPCPPEQAEQLEQLRVLWHGERIAVHVADEMPGIGVDTPEELERVRAYFVVGARR